MPAQKDCETMSNEPATTNEPRPEIVTDEHLDYLDELRESGVTNMLGAAPYLADAFEMDKQDARKVLSYWMASYGERHPQHA